MMHMPMTLAITGLTKSSGDTDDDLDDQGGHDSARDAPESGHDGDHEGVDENRVAQCLNVRRKWAPPARRRVRPAPRPCRR